MTLLAFRFVDRETPGGDPWRSLLILLLTAQIGMAFAVNAADAEYASSYRDFAASFRSRPEKDATVWFVGHWGWMHYAEQAGFRQLHRDGPPPREGDVLIWPARVHIGDALSGRLEFRESLELEDEFVYDGRIPLRTMNFECAAFYATIRGNLPYCWQNAPLERFRVFRVR